MRRLLLKLLPSAAVPAVESVVPLRRMPSEQQVCHTGADVCERHVGQQEWRLTSFAVAGVWLAALGRRGRSGRAVDGAGAVGGLRIATPLLPTCSL